MNSIPKGKFIASLAGMFLVGILTGGLAVSALRNHKEVRGPISSDRGTNRPFGKNRDGGQRGQSPGSFAESMMGMLGRNLQLTTVQSNNILPKVELLGRDIDQIRAKGFKETDQHFKDFKAWLLPLLTEEQQATHAKMEERRQSFMNREGSGRGGKGGRPGGPGPRGGGGGPGGGPPYERGPGEPQPPKDK